MEKKLAVIVDNKEEITTEVVNTELCSSACDVAVETCSSENTDTCGDGGTAFKKIVEIKVADTNSATLFVALLSTDR